MSSIVLKLCGETENARSLNVHCCEYERPQVYGVYFPEIIKRKTKGLFSFVQIKLVVKQRMDK